MTALAAGQTWRPENGEPERKIEEYRATRIGDNCPFGIMLVRWCGVLRWGYCTERSFQEWIRKTKATCRG